MALAKARELLDTAAGALRLPESSFRTEYDRRTAVELNRTRLADAADAVQALPDSDAVAVLRAGIAEALAGWTDRGAEWDKARQTAEAQRSTLSFGATSEAWLKAMQEEAEQEEGATGRKKKKGKPARDKKKKQSLDSDDDDGMGQRGASLVAALGPGDDDHPRTQSPGRGGKGQGRTPPRSPTAAAPAPEQWLSYPDLPLAALPVEAVAGAAAAVEPVPGQATVVLRMAAPFAPLLAPVPAAKKGRPQTPPKSPRRKAATPPPPSVPPQETVVELHRAVLRAYLGLVYRAAGEPLAIIPQAAVAECVVDITNGVTSQAKAKARRQQRWAAEEREVPQAAEDEASVADTESTAGPMGGHAATAEYQAPPSCEGDVPSDDAEDSETEPADDAALRELSAQLVAQFAQQEDADAEGAMAEDLAKQLPPSVAAGQLQWLPVLSEAPWVVLMCHGGYFAGAVYVRGEPVVHKSFHRYVVRKKQGGKQSSQEGKFNSAGSQIRKAQEIKWRVDVKRILHDWRHLIDAAWAIAYVAPSPENRKILTDFAADNWQPRLDPDAPSPASLVTAQADSATAKFFATSPALRRSDPALSPIDMADPRAFSAPLTTHAPSFVEVQRIFTALRGCTVKCRLPAAE